MKLWSNSWVDGDRIPAALSPPAGPTQRPPSPSPTTCQPAPGLERGAGRHAQSFALICHDFDVPSRGDDVNQTDREVPADLPRVDFFHWVMVDLPPRCATIAEGEFSRGFTPRGKPAAPATLHGARHGLNDYTGWFAGDAEPWPATTSATTGRSRRSTIRWCTTTCSRSTRSTWRGSPVEGALHRRAGARGDRRPRAGRGDALGHLHAEPRLAAEPRRPCRADAQSLALRHGETAWNVDTRIQGQLDVPLNDKGRWQARRLAQALADEGIGVDLRQRPGARARDRAGGRPRHRPAGAADAGLRERGFGVFEGQTWAEIERAGPSESAALAPRDPDFGPGAARRCATSTRAASAPPRAWRRATRADDRAGRARRRDGLPVPRRDRVDLRGAAHLAARQRQHQPAALHAEGFTLVGWARHRAPRRRARRTDDMPRRRSARPSAGPHPSRPACIRAGTTAPRRATRSPPIDTPGAGDRPRRDGAQPRSAWPRSRARTACACGRTPRRTRARPSPGCRWPPARSACACRSVGEAEALADGRRARHLHQQRGRRPGQAGARGRAGRPRAAGDRGRLARSASTGSRAALQAPGTTHRRVRRGRRRPGPLRRRAAPRPARSRTRWCRTGLRFAGLQAYHGRAQHLRSAAEREAAIAPRRGPGARRAGRAHGRRHRLPAGHRRRHRHLRARGRQRRLRRAAGRQLRLHGPRLRRQRSRRRVRRRFEHALFVQEPGDEPRRLARAWSTPATSRTPSTPACRASGAATTSSSSNGGDEHGILRRARRSGGAAGAGRHRLAGARPLRPDRQPARPLVVVRGGLEGGLVEAVWPVDARGAVE